MLRNKRDKAVTAHVGLKRFQRKREQKHKLHIKNLIVAIAVQSVVPNMIIEIAKIIQIARPLIF